VIRFLDGESQLPLAFIIVEGKSDEQNGYLGINSELAGALSRSEPDEEVTLTIEGQERRLFFIIHEPAVKQAA
jgi:transcription elongation GreA/GreB family factor